MKVLKRIRARLELPYNFELKGMLTISNLNSFKEYLASIGVPEDADIDGVVFKHMEIGGVNAILGEATDERID